VVAAVKEFQALVADVDYPMFIVTSASGGERAGCLVGFVTQASIEPPRLAVLISKANHTSRVAAGSEELVVHFLGTGNGDLASLFGERTGDEMDKFAHCDWQATAAGTPVLEGTRGWAAGPILLRVDAGDHVIYLVDVVRACCQHRGRQLGFQAVKGLRPGHPV
jgi:flavin reductase (DIM6/NTAB) family NADH-FMN oxidoreductase RutF